MPARTLVVLAALAASASLPTHARAAGEASRRATVTSLATAGRELCDQTRWGEAVRAFEAAVDEAPGDAAVLSDLGWAAFRAGDHARARAVLERALRLARKPAVKASILYNLGRVDEAAGRMKAAQRRYRASLALRKSGVVAARLAGIESSPDAPLPLAAAVEGDGCREPRPIAKLCACAVRSRAEDSEDAEVDVCELWDEAPAPDLRVARVRVESMEYLFLVQARGDAWSLGGKLAELWSSGVFGQYGEFGEVSASRETAGGRGLLRLHVTATSRDSDLGVNEISNDETETETICLLGRPGEAPRCVLSVPIRFSHERTELYDPSEFTEEELANIREHGTKGLPIRRARTLRVDVGDDGVAQVVLVEGPEPEESDGVTLGPVRLW